MKSKIVSTLSNLFPVCPKVLRTGIHKNIPIKEIKLKNIIVKSEYQPKYCPKKPLTRGERPIPIMIDALMKLKPKGYHFCGINWRTLTIGRTIKDAWKRQAKSKNGNWWANKPSKEPVLVIHSRNQKKSLDRIIIR